MLKAVSFLLSFVNIPTKAVDSIGIGVPGLLDKANGISFFSPNFMNWENVPISKRFEQELGIPTFIDNDVRMHLYGEWYYGSRSRI